MAVTRWHFVRHAPVIGAHSMLYVTPDEPADCSNSAAFAFLAGFLPQKDPLLLSSGLKRTNATAAAIRAAGWQAAEPMIEPRLAEQYYGAWHGKSLEEIAALRTNPPHKHWWSSAQDVPEGGESFQMLYGRTVAAMDDWTAKAQGRDIVAVAHGGTVRAALAYALGLDLERALTISCANLSVTRIDHVPGEGLGGDWRVVYINRRP